MLSAPIGVGAVAMLTKSRAHWLEIDYQIQDFPKAYVIRMDKKNYMRILDAIKTRTGKETEILWERKEKVVSSENAKGVRQSDARLPNCSQSRAEL